MGGRIAWRAAGAALLASALWIAPARAQMGIAAGFNTDYLSDISAGSVDIDVASTGGWHLGIFLNWNVAVLGIRPAVYYHRVNDFLIETTNSAAAFNLDMIEVPLDLRLRFPLPVITPYLVAAPVVSFPSSGNEAIDASLENTPWRVDVGFGFEISFGLRLWPEARFGFGVTDFFKDEIDLGDEVVTSESTVRHNTFVFRLGVSF